MAKQIEYRFNGITLPTSYWELVQINLSPTAKTGRIVFYGYADQAAKDNGEKPIGSKSYQITPEIYETYFAMIDNRSAIVESSYNLAVSTKDIIQKEGKPVSLFETAIDV